MRFRQTWVIEQKELETKGYRFNEQGECIFDPTVSVELPKVEPVIHRIIEVEPKKKIKPEKIIFKGRKKNGR